MPRLNKAFLTVSARAEVAAPTRTKPANSQEKSFARMIISSPEWAVLKVATISPDNLCRGFVCCEKIAGSGKKRTRYFTKSGKWQKEG
jgi:hypothetical protein